ncbi:MAG: DUF983 domain-containing protein [Alphaproteobacteria bacterium]|nr:DUF983 domain-containing protein [Alphaproteobacteria bacterium]
MSNATNPFWPTIRRSTRGRCPKCGDAPLYKSYLKPVDNCAACEEPIGHIRADDGPAWLTIVLVTHIIAPVLLVLLPGNNWPIWLVFAIIIVPTLALMLILLPLCKGFFIGMIWRSGCIGAEN